jgi:hypothetical protein
VPGGGGGWGRPCVATQSCRWSGMQPPTHYLLEAHGSDGSHAAPEQNEQQQAEDICALAVLVLGELRLVRGLLFAAAEEATHGDEEPCAHGCNELGQKRQPPLAAVTKPVPDVQGAPRQETHADSGTHARKALSFVHAALSTHAPDPPQHAAALRSAPLFQTLQKVTLWGGVPWYHVAPYRQIGGKPPPITMSALLLEWAATLGLAKPLESLERDLANGVALGQALVAIGVAPAEVLDSLVDKTSVREQ